jgi:hypothetical protein
MKHTRCLQHDWDHSGLSGLQLHERGISSVEEYVANRKDRLRQKDELLAYLARPDVSGTDKGYARCAYLLRNGKLPFQCRQVSKQQQSSTRTYAVYIVNAEHACQGNCEQGCLSRSTVAA